VVAEDGPEGLTLKQNSPNPFNRSTVISFTLKKVSAINLKIYNIKGKEITTLAYGNYNAGIYKFVWNGTDYNGHKVCPGIYYYRLEAGSLYETKTMVLYR